MAKGYSLDALVQERWSRYTVPIEGGSDLNNYNNSEVCGIYMIPANNTADTIINIPVKVAGTLEVIPWSASAGCVTQRYTTYNTATVWNRSYSGASWSVWKRTVTALDVFDVVYPIGIVIKFDNATNPNNAFTGTVWEQITDGRAARAATSATAGTSDGQIGSVAGSDSVSIAVGNLPSHTHNMRYHTHTIGSHSHTMAHTHSINHDHGAVTSSSSGAHTHSVSGSTNNTGAHTHGYTDGAQSSGTRGDWDSDGLRNTVQTSSAGAHAHTVTGTAASAGAHTHSVDLPNFTGTSGGSSAANTGGASLTTDGPNNNTSDATGGGNNLDVRNSSHYYAFWKRVA